MPLRVPHQPATKTTGAPSFAVSPRRVGCNASTATTPLPLLLAFCLCLLLCFCLRRLLSSCTRSPQNRHLDRSDSQLHRESRSGETPAFRFLAFVLLLAIALVLAVGIRAALSAPPPARPRTTTALPPATSSGMSVAPSRVEGEATDDLPLFLPLFLLLHLFFFIFRPKIACQAPKPSNSLNPKQIEFAS